MRQRDSSSDRSIDRSATRSSPQQQQQRPEIERKKQKLLFIFFGRNNRQIFPESFPDITTNPIQ